jgi:sugar O-acyltransferase (sialic acid O-acetyltransferase NeuD family)
MRIGLIGVNPAGALAIDILERSNSGTEFLYYDDDKEKHQKKFHGVQVVGDVNSVATDFKKGSIDFVIICFGDKNLLLKNKIYHMLSAVHVPFINAIHNSFIKGKGAQEGCGNIVAANVTIGQEVQLGRNLIIWSGVVIEHNSSVGNCCYFGPNATVSGFSVIGDYVMIGSGAVILPEVKVGSGAIIGAGAVVTKNVEENTIVAGVPARPFTKF